MGNHYMVLNSEQIKIMKVANKRKKVTCNQFNWWVLDDMVKKGALDKVLPRDGRHPGWPYFQLSPRGRRHLNRILASERSQRPGRRNVNSS